MILGLIPARGGSKGIPDKNIKPLNGKPLIAYTIEAALKSQLLTQVVVSTDSDQIASVAQKYGATIPFKRPLDLAQDDTPALSVVQHAITQLFTMPLGKEDIVILLQPTSPLRTTQHIDEAITVLLQRPDATAVVSVHPVPHQFAPSGLMHQDTTGVLHPCTPTPVLRRQDKPILWARNGPAILGVKASWIAEGHHFYDGLTLAYPMGARSSIDIDTLWDFQLAEWALGHDTYS